MKPAPELSVIVVTYASRDTIAACLASVAEEGKRFAVELTIIDNASPDDTLAVTRAAVAALGLESRTTIHALPTNLGFASANNFAAERVTGRILLLLNPDAALSPRAAVTLVEELERNPDAGVAGPRITRPDGRWERSHGPMPSLVGELLQKSLGSLDRLNPPGWRRLVAARNRRPRRPVWVSGACLAISRRLWRELGGMDQEMFLYYEDVDLCVQARAAGRDVVYLPSAGAVHIGGASTATRRGVAALAHRQSQIHFYAKHHGAAFATLVARALELRFAVNALLLRLRGRSAEADELRDRGVAIRAQRLRVASRP